MEGCWEGVGGLGFVMLIRSGCEKSEREERSVSIDVVVEIHSLALSLLLYFRCFFVCFFCT